MSFDPRTAVSPRSAVLDESHEAQRWSQSNPRLLWLVAPVVVALVALLIVALAALLAPQQTAQDQSGGRASTTCGSSCL